MEWETDRAREVHRAIELIIHNSRMHHRLIEKECGDSGIHRSQRKVLMYLSESTEPRSQKEIAERFDISSACITRMLKGLVADGYVLRTGDKTDQRRYNICISEKGLQLMNDSYRAFDQFDQRMFNDFSSEDLETLCTLLEHMQENLRACEQEEDKEGSALH